MRGRYTLRKCYPDSLESDVRNGGHQFNLLREEMQKPTGTQVPARPQKQSEVTWVELTQVNMLVNCSLTTPQVKSLLTGALFRCW